MLTLNMDLLPPSANASMLDATTTAPTSAAAPGENVDGGGAPVHTLVVQSSASPGGTTRKRSSVSVDGGEGDSFSPNSDDTAVPNRRKTQKVSRACDHCKRRKARCTGTLPCSKCASKGLTCVYDASYSRGRPPTPPPSRHHFTPKSLTSAGPGGSWHPPQQQPSRASDGEDEARASSSRPLDGSGLASRASPELGVAEIEGQVFDPTSGVTFLHRAWNRLTKHGHSSLSPGMTEQPSSEHQHIMLAGDRPLPKTTEDDLYRLALPLHQDLVDLLALYFDVCIATYRILHRPTVEEWLKTIEGNVQQGKPAWKGIGKSRTAILLGCLSLATAHHEKSRGVYSPEDDAAALARSDHLFGVCMQLTETETGSPSLHSAQARIIQTLYLLTTSRMNKAWYTFGNALQIISALGLHRQTARQRQLAPSQVDYLQGQLRMRTFWTAYILDKYLGVIFGRPRHFHDEDIDQDIPDRVEDEDMTAQGPSIAPGEHQLGCHTDALIFHAKLAKIIGQISREVYSIRPISEDERTGAAHRLGKEIEQWKQSLPAYLVSVRPSMLVTSFRRQFVVLKLAYCHAIMHANRLFLLATSRHERKVQIDECLGAARDVFEVVDGLAHDGPMFHAFWWTQYVTFCALVVSYVWDIQLKRKGTVLVGDDRLKHERLMDFARRCQVHLGKATASNSPSRRYAVILEEFCSEAMGQKRTETTSSTADATQGPRATKDAPTEPFQDTSYPAAMDGTYGGYGLGYSLLDEWNTTDWLELDSSAFGPYMNVDTCDLWTSVPGTHDQNIHF